MLYEVITLLDYESQLAVGLADDIFLTIYANTQQELLTFKLYDELTAQETELKEQMLFSINGVAGTVPEPVPFTLLRNNFV